MYNQPFTPDKIQTLEDIHVTIDLLYITQCRATKNALLNRLRRLLAQMTTPYPNYSYGGNAIPVDWIPGVPAYASVEGAQGAQQGLPQPEMAKPEMPPQQVPQNIRENIPPYIPQGMQSSTQIPPPSRPQQAPREQQAPSQTQQPRPKIQDLKTFTIEELGKYDGKGDNPAYVSVNGMVYDVTDQPGWAAGSHFGLKAGLDQTGAYISCHTGQPMIDRLKLVGRLAK